MVVDNLFKTLLRKIWGKLIKCNDWKREKFIKELSEYRNVWLEVLRNHLIFANVKIESGTKYDDDDYGNDDEIPVRGNAKCIIGITTSLNCYKKKKNEKTTEAPKRKLFLLLCSLMSRSGPTITFA